MTKLHDNTDKIKQKKYYHIGKKKKKKISVRVNVKIEVCVLMKTTSNPNWIT